MAATDGKFFLAKSSFTVLIHRAVSQKYCKISYHLTRDKKMWHDLYGPPYMRPNMFPIYRAII